MTTRVRRLSTKKGFLLVEAVVAACMAAVILSAFLSIQSAFFRVKREGLVKMQASYYAMEAMEAVRRIRDDPVRGYTNAGGIKSFSTSDDGIVDRFIPKINGDWHLVSYTETEHNATYNPKDRYQIGVYFYTVNRTICSDPQDAQNCGAITSGSGSDDRTRRVMVRVCWSDPTCQSLAPGGDKEVVMETYLTNWKN